MGRAGAPFIATSPQGEEFRGIGLRGFCDQHGVRETAARKVIDGTNRATQEGWVFARPDEDEDTSGWPKWSTGRKGVDGMKPLPKVPVENFDDVFGKDKDPVKSAIDKVDGLAIPDDPAEYAKGILDASGITPEEKVRALLDLAMRVGMGVYKDGQEPPVGWKSTDIVKLAQEYAKASGIDWSRMADRRTDAQIFEDTTKLILNNPEALFEVTDETLDIMEAQLAEIEKHAAEHWEKLSTTKAKDMLPPAAMPDDQDPEEPPGPKAIAAISHRWVRRVRRVRELAHQARERCNPNAPLRERRIQESTHLLRFQLYVGRSDIRADRETDKVYRFGRIHVESCMGLYLSRGGYGLVPGVGLLAPGDPFNDKGMPFEGINYAGTLILMPPRHGKTDLIIHDMGLAIDENPTIQMAIVHDKEDEASKILRSVAVMFNQETAPGRRNFRLFPYELSSTGNNATNLRLKTDNPPKNPNLMAASVWSSAQGNNLDRLYGDDLVPQSDLDEAATRTRRTARYHGTWGSRDQGARAFSTLTGYPRHYDDLMWRTYQGAKRSQETNGREGMNYYVVRKPVGGPKPANGRGAFYSIWDRYPSKWLRDKYRSFNDRSLWNANYMLDPMPDDARLVGQLRFIDKESDEYRRFMQTAEHHLSVDPAGNKRSGKEVGDKAGLVLGSFGSMYSEHIDEHGNTHLVQEQVLVIERGAEFYASQNELIGNMVKIAQSRAVTQPVSMAHVETTGVGNAIIDFMEEQHGINRVVDHRPTQSKEVRFKAVAGLYEHTDPKNAPAKVLFAGVSDRDEDGVPIPNRPLRAHPDVERLTQYILNYSVESGFHSLDAANQLVKYGRDRGLIGMGTGASDATFSGQSIRPGLSRRKHDRWKRYEREQRERDQRGDDVSPLCALSNEGI